MRYYDISPPITTDLAVFPGDTPPTREILLDMKSGKHLTLSTLHATVHLGAHVDGPVHYGPDAAGVDALPIDLFVGPCQVMHLRELPSAHRITTADLVDPITSERLLLRTDTYPDPQRWTKDFAGLAPECVDMLADRGVRLLGIDTPSVDVADATTLVAHHRFLARDVAILEGIVLSEVPEGTYELMALPLRLVGFDASPVRAVLRAD